MPAVVVVCVVGCCALFCCCVRRDSRPPSSWHPSLTPVLRSRLQRSSQQQKEQRTAPLSCHQFFRTNWSGRPWKQQGVAVPYVVLVCGLAAGLLPPYTLPCHQIVGAGCSVRPSNRSSKGLLCLLSLLCAACQQARAPSLLPSFLPPVLRTQELWRS